MGTERNVVTSPELLQVRNTSRKQSWTLRSKAAEVEQAQLDSRLDQIELY